MTIQPEVVAAVTIIVLSAFVLMLLVAVLYPAALKLLVQPLLDIISKLVDLLRKDPPQNP